MHRQQCVFRDWAKGQVFYLVLQLGQEEGQQMLYSVVLAQDGGEAHDDGGQGRLHMLICVGHQLLLINGVGLVLAFSSASNQETR